MIAGRISELWRTRLFALASLVLLATIAVQAIPSAPLPTMVEHGSAFSASTAELAVAARRDDSGVAQVQAWSPTQAVVPRDSKARTIVSDRSDLKPVWPAVQARGPPPRTAIGPQHSPRAPPAT